jgi:hypothetical protein
MKIMEHTIIVNGANTWYAMTWYNAVGLDMLCDAVGHCVPALVQNALLTTLRRRALASQL